MHLLLCVGWVSPSRLGNFMRYYQVNFINLTMVSSIQLQTVGSYAPVTQYKLSYSNDGINWIDGETVSNKRFYLKQ
jgi:F5/8 type C domain